MNTLRWLLASLGLVACLGCSSPASDAPSSVGPVSQGAASGSGGFVSGSGGVATAAGGIPGGNGGLPSGNGGLPSGNGGLPSGNGGLANGNGGLANGSGGTLSTGGASPGTGGGSTLGPYPTGPYAVAVNSYLPDLRLSGYLNEAAVGLSNQQPWVDLYTMDNLRASGAPYALVHVSEFL